MLQPQIKKITFYFQRLKVLSTAIRKEWNHDFIIKGAAALAYYLTLSIFPALIFLCSVFAYLPIENLQELVMQYFQQVLPGDASLMFEKVVAEVVLNERAGLLSFALFMTLWTATSGIVAAMDHLNRIYRVQEIRGWVKTRLIAFFLMWLFTAMIIGVFIMLIIASFAKGYVQNFFIGLHLQPTFFRCCDGLLLS
ncbi:MAG: YhjD/YihY/BrkB family envelope integrity protein [Bdellovibrionota bacterium]